MRRAVLLLLLASACTSGSGFTGDYEAVAHMAQQGGCGGVQSVEPISPNDQFFRLDDVDGLVAYFACTDLDHCDDLYDLTLSFGQAKDNPDGWAGYVSTAIPAASCVLSYRVRRLTAVGNGVAIDEQLFRDMDPTLSGAACNDTVARERGEGMPCVEESRLVAEDGDEVARSGARRVRLHGGARDGNEQSSIVGGSPAPGDTAIVALARRSTSCTAGIAPFTCTGTLVAPRAVVTAAHCLAAGPPNALEVVFGATYTETGGTRIPVIGGAAHPQFDEATHANDIAVLILAAPAPLTVTPVPLATSLPDLTGMDVRLVGFGATSGTATDVGERRAGTARVTEQSAEELRMAPGPAMSCRGDSGGPVLRDSPAELIGVTSYGDPACTQLGVAMRVDHHAAFLQPLLTEAAMPPARRAFDPDEPLCSTSCEVDADCPDETACFMGRCSYRGLPAGQLGEACTTDGDCTCIAVPDGTCREYIPCFTEGETTCKLAGDPGCGCRTGGGSGAMLALLVMMISGTAVRARRTDRTADR